MTASGSITIVADSNIAYLDAFFNQATLSQADVTLVAVSGREITAALLERLQPSIVLVRSVSPVDEQLLAHNHSVQFVGSATIGTDHVDQAYLASRGIAFANAAGCSKHSVAQYVLTAILSLRPKYWQQPMQLGIIGLGNIGSTLARYATDLGWQVLGYDPLLPSSAINNTSLEQLLTHSDTVSLHVPLTHQVADTATQDHATYHMIDHAALTMMSPQTLLLNTARGPVIQQAALQADMARTQRQVVLDVFELEPYVSGELLGKLAIATPHIAGYTLEGKVRGTQMIYEALCAALGVTPMQLASHHLPEHEYDWSVLKAHPERLSRYYDIGQDDKALRAAAREGQVEGASFDALRRGYRLRREWRSDSLITL